MRYGLLFSCFDEIRIWLLFLAADWKIELLFLFFAEKIIFSYCCISSIYCQLHKTDCMQWICRLHFFKIYCLAAFSNASASLNTSHPLCRFAQCYHFGESRFLSSSFCHLEPSSFISLVHRVFAAFQIFSEITTFYFHLLLLSVWLHDWMPNSASSAFTPLFPVRFLSSEVRQYSLIKNKTKTSLR